MANRQLQRSVLLQTLYQWDIRGLEYNDIQYIFSYTAKSFNEIRDEDMTLLQDTVFEIAKKQVIIDEIITKAAPSWPIEKISITDRNVLRIGLYELLFGDREQVPPKVAINEAIELSKKFGSPKSGKFVNGVIGAVYREIGEPGKDDVVKPKKNNVPLDEMSIEKKGSAVVYSIDEKEIIRIGMVHDVFGYWTLSKGTINPDETPEEGTVREVKEKTNWDVNIIEKLGENEYIAYPPDTPPVRKQVQYFLAEGKHTKPTLEKKCGGLDDVRWFELDQIKDLTIYQDVSEMIIKSMDIIMNSNNVATEKLGTKSPDLSSPDFASMKLVELRQLASDRGLTNYSKIKKAELIDLLLTT